MAQGTKNKKTGTKKSSQSRTRKQAQNTKAQEPEFIRGEVLLIASFALAVLLFLSNFHLCGVAGDFLRKVQLGVFGMIGFVAPVLLFVGTCFGMSNQGNPIAALKMAAAAAGTLTLCGLAEMLFGSGYRDGQKILDAFSRSAEHGLGGGLAGSLLAQGLGSVVGVVGTYLILLVLLAICAVCVTEKSLIAAVKKGGGKAYRYAKEDADRRRVIHEERKEERRELKRLREEQRVRGVNLNSTRLGYEEDFSDEEYQEDQYYEEYEQEDYEEYTEDSGYDQTGFREEYEQDNVRKAVPRTASRDMPDEEHREDVFTGKISIPDSYINEEDDTVPFDADDVIIVHEALRAAWQEEADAAVADQAEETEVCQTEGTETYGSEETEIYQEEEQEIYQADKEAIPENITHHIPETSVNRTLAQEEYRSSERFPTTEIVDDFETPEETKRVVTASGKIIEHDTEALKKKLESRRQEVREEKGTDALSVAAQIQQKEVIKKEYQFPPVSLLSRGNRPAGAYSEQEYRDTAIKLQQTLKNFGVGVTVTNISCGPAVTRYELHPEQGVKVSKIVGLADDIKLSLAAADIRIEAPIPGKSAVGIEVPNKENVTVYLREIFESDEFKKASSRLSFAVGKDIGGQVVVTNIAKMPHLLIAGATGSGKSVCINTLIMSILFKASPDEVKMIMVDPKVVELSAYNGIPHLLIPVVTDPKKASGALNWAVAEMMSRYDKFAHYGVRNLEGYNAKIEKIKDIEDENKPEKMPQIVIIVDELADLMMVSPGEVEDAICRLAQLARAAGIHLVIATQRPSVNVITGLIKANVPSRIAFAVSSGVDSRTIIDMYGAEKLLGKGDMLFFPSGIPKPQRVQGAFVSDQEVAAVVEFLTAQNMTTEYRPDIESQISAPSPSAAPEPKNNGRDEYFEQAGKFIIEKEKASIGMLQRMYKIGFNRAARIMDQLAQAGVVGEEEGTKPRRVLMTMEEFEDLLAQES